MLLAVDFMNYTYATNPCTTNVPVRAVMRSGSFYYEDPQMGQAFTVTVKSVQRGSLQPGTHQALVVLQCEFPIGGTAAAYVFDEQKTGAVLLRKIAVANWGGDWGDPNGIKATFGRERLVVDSCQDDYCELKASKTYALHAGKLVLLSMRTYKPGT